MIAVATFLKLSSLLLVGNAVAITLEQSIRIIKDAGKEYLVAPELFRDSSFAFASIDEQNDSQKEINVTLSIVGRNSSNDLKCSFVLKADRRAKSVGLNSLRRLGDKKVLLVGYEELHDGERHAMTISFDLQSCESTYFLSTSMVPEMDRIVTSSNSDEFTAFVPSYKSNSPLFCPNGRRRIVLGELYQYSDCFDVDLLWSGMKVGPLFSESNRFMVRGFDANGTYKVLDFNSQDHPRERPELISLPDATDQTQFVSSGDALCYLIKPGEDKWVHCLAFVKRGNTYIKIVAFGEPVELAAVSYSFYPEQELILVTEKIKCDDADCGVVVITSMSQIKNDTKTYSLKLGCSGRSRSAIGVERMLTKGSIALEYVCDYSDELDFHTVNVNHVLGFNGL